MPTKPLSWNEIRARLDQFTREFKDESNEHAEYATFWDELLACYGVNRRRVATFQHVAKRASTGNIGFIDFFWPKVVIGEHKSLGKMGPSGSVAEDQAFDYLAGGSIPAEDFPRYIISTDYAHMRVTDLESSDAEGNPRSTYFPITDLRHHAEELGFLGGYEAVSINTEEQEAASIAAAKVMADLYAALTHDADEDYVDNVPAEDPDEEEVHATSILLTRLLFLMFGDDADLWERGLFTRFIEERTAEDGSDLGAQLSLLFGVLDTPRDRRPHRLDELLQRFPYVNGGIFDGSEKLGLLAFDRPMWRALLQACYFEWSGISPAVFGSLFQAVKSKESRRAAGEHYTTETNILKTLNPLFLDEYRARVRAAWHSARKLKQIQEELATNIYCDPACGCGNFLVIAYRELRDIELQIITRLRDLEGRNQELTLDVTMGLRVSLDQFHGFELGWWPAKIAETAMFLVDHQANLKMAKSLGMAPERLPIAITAHIRHTNALTLDWQDALPKVTGRTFLFGNPPFLGHATRNEGQAEELRRIWRRKDIGRLDYVTAWHARTLDFFRGDGGRSGEWAYVTTNSIVQGEPVPTLFGPIFADGWHIKFAHRTFAWQSEAPGAAAVHCVIVGFTHDDRIKPRLFEYPTFSGEPQEIAVTRRINAYLVDGANVLVEQRRKPLNPDLPEATFGNMPRDGGNLVIEPEDYEAVMADPVAAKYVRPYVGSRELLHNERRWCLWLTDLDPADLGRSPVLASRVQAVKTMREQSKAASTRGMARTPYLFGQRSQPTTSYLMIPSVVSESRPFFTVDRKPAEVIASNLVFHADDPDGFLFAIVSSSMFITWQRTIGGRLESRLRFSNTIVWNNLPLPSVATDLRGKIIEAGQKVLDARAMHPERSLAHQYNPLAMDPALLKAHASLDKLVDKAFGCDIASPTEADRQATLFNQYDLLTRNHS